MKYAVLLLTVVAANASTIIFLVHDEWNAFKGKNPVPLLGYKDKVAKHNEAHAQGLTSFRMGLNEFSDRFPSEIQRMHGYKRNTVPAPGVKHTLSSYDELPISMDWVSKGAVTEVKNQGQCGSCWSFSATGALEGQHFRKTGKLVSLSEQNLLDCSGFYGTNGCDGGFAVAAFTYVAGNGGIDSERSYRYKQVDALCRFNSKYSNVTARGYVSLFSGDERSLQIALLQVGPISVAMDASPISFAQYSEGVYFVKECSAAFESLNHEVLLVGYGTEQPGGDFWLIKNSYGTSWGINGYMKLARNRGNQCGVATDASYPLV